MMADEQVTHPEVTHPDTITLKVAPDRPKGSEETAKPRTRRNRFRMPPPRVVAAVALVAAAVELLIWQVGGLVWGGAVHAGLAAAGLAAAGVVLWWRRRSVRRSAGRVPGQAAAGGIPGGRRGPFGKLFSGRKSKSPKSGQRPGVLGKLVPVRRGSSGGPGRSGAAGRPGATAAGPSRSRSPKGSGTPSASAGRPTGSKPGGSKPGKTSAWDDFLYGLRGEQAQPARRKPSPGPTAHKATENGNTKDTTATTDELVKEAVKAADAAEKNAAPAPAVPSPRIGGAMGDMNRVRAAASELAAALRDYDPESMHHLVRDIPGLGDALADVAAGVRQMASRAESEWPVAAPVAEALRTVADDIRAGAGTAEEARAALHRENEVDIERGVAPRHGSRDIEAKWDVRGAE